MNIIRARLQSQHLVGKKFQTPEEVVEWLGAVQAQEFPAAKWGIGLRMQNATEGIVEKAFNEGRILRTHVMRPTWHFVFPRDIRWMLELTAPRVKKTLASYNRKLKLDDKLLAKTNNMIVKSLEKHTYLTRKELKEILAGKGVKTNVQRLAHIVVWAELDGLIASGPLQGKQHTYALLSKRAPKTKRLFRDRALAKLALMYFRSHGPAQVKDFAWWSGLSMDDTRQAIESVKAKLKHKEIDGKTYWFVLDTKIAGTKSPLALLLSIFDEYTIAYNDRSDISGMRYIEKMMQMGNALTSVLILNGKVEGTWKRALKKDHIELAVRPFRRLSTVERRAIAVAADQYGIFHGLPVNLTPLR